MNSPSKYQRGSLLIEAVVAILVLAVGTFGVVKLNSVLLKGGGESKIRAEALQIAQTRIESLMTNGALGQCPITAASTTEPSPINGLNATYRVGQDLTNVLRDRVDVAVYIAWDGNTDPRAAPANQQIVLRTVIACGTAGTSGLIGGDALKTNAGNLPRPTGVASVGGRADPTCATGCVQSTAAQTGMAADGLKVFTTGNLVELVDIVANKVLLTIKDGSQFSSISGRVYIQTSANGQPIINPQGSSVSDPSDDLVFLLTSDAAYCARVFPLNPVPTGSTGNATKYVYFDYNCYVSKGWWGNVGIVQVGSASASNKVCVGDVAPTDDPGGLFSRLATLSTTRGYRGFRNLGVPNSTVLTDYTTVGIGYALDSNAGIVASTYAPMHIGAVRSQNYHDFLIANITGQNDCTSSGVMTLTGTRAANEFTSNVGKYFCMAQCPPLTPADSVQSTLVHGTITVYSSASLLGVDPNDCQTAPTWTQTPTTGTATSYTYSCLKTWAGFAGSMWNGGINFQYTGTNSICTNASGSQPIVSPSGLTVASTVNNNLAADPFKNSITFTDVALGVTDVEINFDVYPNGCPTLGVPQVSWSAQTPINLLSWPAIIATGGGSVTYNILTCTLSGNASSCTPNVATVTNLATTTYTPSAPSGNNKGACYSIQATSSSSTGVSSAAKCFVRSGSTFSYY